MLEARFPPSHMAHFKVIDISLEECLAKGLFLPLLAKGCKTRDRVGKPVVAKVCKSFQNLAIANT